MTLPIPFPIYGYIKDSNGDIIPNLSFEISGTSIVTVQSDASGKYLYNIQDIATEGNSITLSASYLGEHISVSWIVSLTPPAKNIDIQLQDSLSIGEKTLNAYRSVGDDAYLFTSTSTESILKISDIDWTE